MSITIPLGTVVAWAGGDTTYWSNYATNWHVCDGTVLSQEAYPDLYKVIGTANGGDSQTFNLPNYQGRFLRGSSGTLAVGQTSAFTTAQDPTSTIGVQFDRMAGPSNSSCYEHYSSPEIELVRWQSGSTNFVVNGFDNESRPDNVYMYFLIKILPDTSDATTANIPTGSVIPYSGADVGTPVAPDFPSWFKCSGSSYQSAGLSELDYAFGNNLNNNPWATATTQPGNFVSPNLIGMFIRGVDLNGSVDPDHGKRIPAPNGNKGGVGSAQKYATCITNATISIQYYNTRQDDYYAGYTHNVLSTAKSTNQYWVGGGRETRPSNLAVGFYMNTSVKATFPVGGIIAIPGLTAPDISIWIPCDGRTYDTTKYAKLATVLQSCWGSGKVPNLQSYFLRGSNTVGNGYNGGDPEWNKRWSLITKADQVGTGSYQKFATAMPSNLNITISYCVGNGNATDGRSDDIPAYPTQSPTAVYPVTGDLSNETAPAFAVVNFYIYCGPTST